jgi:serine/threonine-protein kinase
LRSDIYAFGSTLYHLLTNTPPSDARERFLDPTSLIPPRQINSEISADTERAILWAMQLHPDDRPDNVTSFRQSLFGERKTIPNPRLRNQSLLQLTRKTPERALWLVSMSLVALSLLLTLMR